MAQNESEIRYLTCPTVEIKRKSTVDSKSKKSNSSTTKTGIFKEILE